MSKVEDNGNNILQLQAVSYICSFVRENQKRIDALQGVMSQVEIPGNPFTLGVSMLLQDKGSCRILSEYNKYMSIWCPSISRFEAMKMLNIIIEEGVDYYSVTRTVPYRGKDSL